MPKQLRTSSSKLKFTSFYGDEDQEDCSAGVTITITPPDAFRLMRLSLAFDDNVAPTITITQDNPEGAAWDQLIRRVSVPAPGAGLTTEYTFIGGKGYEYISGTAIVITISAVAANVNCSWEMEQI